MLLRSLNDLPHPASGLDGTVVGGPPPGHGDADAGGAGLCGCKSEIRRRSVDS